jgi:HEAT repeat protein
VGVEFRRSLILALGDQTEYSLKGLSESAEITNLLTEALQDSDPGIRQQAVIILSKIGKLEKRLDSASVVNLFVEGLHSENPSVLLDAINGLNQFCSKNSKPYKHTSTCPEAKNALPLLINLLKEDIKPLKYAAAFAIIRIKPDQEDVIKVFQEILLEEALSYELSNNAFGALLNIGSPNAIAAIIKSLQSSNKALCYFRTCLGFDSRNLSDNFNHNLLLDALRDENRRFSASLFFEDRATHPRKRQDLVGLEQYQKRLSQDVISQLLSILEEKKNEYKDFPLLKSIFKLKNQDIRRSVVYILGNPSLKGKSYIVNALMQILSDQGEDLNLRWMAATSLQELDMNVDWFFREKQLLNPKSYQCPNPDGRPRLTPEFNFDIYLSQCIYRYGACGAGLSEVYRALMDLLNQSKK